MLFFSDINPNRALKTEAAVKALRAEATLKPPKEGDLSCDGTKAGCNCLKNEREGFFPGGVCDHY